MAKEPGLCVIFLESVCDDPEIIAANVALKVSSGDPDYKDTSREEAKQDFLRRIKEYEAVYQTITEPRLSYIRISNVGHEVTINRIRMVISLSNVQLLRLRRWLPSKPDRILFNEPALET